MQTSMYQQQINRNYNSAVVYYEQRKQMFLRLYQQKTNQSFDNIIQQQYSSFVKQWENFQKNIIKKVQNRTLETKGGYQQFIYTGMDGKRHRLATGLIAEELIKLQENQAALKRAFAVPFEKVLGEYFNPNRVQINSSKVQDFILQHTGAIVQRGFTFGQGVKMIRSDFAFTSGKHIPENMELSHELDSNIQEIQNSFNNPIKAGKKISRLLSQKYLNPNTFAAGFSVKNYSSNIVYTSSITIRNEVNNGIYMYTDPLEADLYMKYVLSKHVIAITSPTVLGLITTKKDGGFAWMSDLLKQNRYIMHLRQNLHSKRFWVNNPGIYFQNKDKKNGAYSVWSGDEMIEIQPFDFYVSENFSLANF